MAQRSRKRRFWRTYSIISGSLSILTLLIFGGALTCRPSWYDPPAVDQEKLAQDKNDLANLMDSIGDALNAGRPIEIEIDEAQLNRWLAAREEFASIAGFEVETPGMELPQVQLLDGNQLRIGATVPRAGARIVVSTTLRFELTEADLRIHLESAHAGVCPLPAGMLRSTLRKAAERDGAEALLEGDAFVVPKEGEWPNGRRGFRITSFEITAGKARIVLSPAL